MIKLGDVCKVVSGSTPKTSIPNYWDGELNWITPAELTEDTIVINESQRKITQEGASSAGLTSFPAGTVILSSRAPIGKTAIAGAEMYCNQGFKNLICSDAIYNKYLFWFLRGKTDYLNSLGRGATFKEISKAIVEDIEIPLPPLETQRQIAAVLDKVSDLIDLRKQQLAKLDELVKARFVEMFGDSHNVPKKASLQDISEFVTVGIANSATQAYSPEGVVMLRNQNIKENHLDDADIIYIKPCFAAKYESKKLKENDILVTRTGYPGIACLVPAKCSGCQTFTTLIVRLKSSSAAFANYVCYYINSSEGKRFVNEMKAGVAQQNFGATALKDMPIFIPEDETVQQFDVFARNAEEIKSTIQHGLDKLETLKSALMQEYFG